MMFAFTAFPNALNAADELSGRLISSNACNFAASFKVIYLFSQPIIGNCEELTTKAGA